MIKMIKMIAKTLLHKHDYKNMITKMITKT